MPFLQREVHPSFSDDLKWRENPRPPGDGRWRLNRTFWMQTTLRHWIRHGDFDVCHFTNAVAPLWCGCPYVVTIHDVGPWRYPQYHYLQRLLSVRPFVPHVVRRAKAVVTDSKSVKDELVQLFRLPEHKVRVVYPGVSPQFASVPALNELARAQRTYGLPDRFILAVGTLEPRKNLVRLLDAYAALVTEAAGRGIGLVIAGSEGWKSRPTMEALSRLDSRLPVLLLGHVPDRTLVSLYHLATVLAFPSLYEGFGLPVVEAMTCGTPVLTSRQGALAEIAGEAAELVNPGRVDSITEGLLRIVGDEQRAAELRCRGLERARSFSWDRAGEEIRDLYQEVITGSIS